MLAANNKTLYGDWSDLKRGGAMTWGVATLLLSLVGNSIILIASLRFKVIRHSKMTVTLIEHIAASDLGVTLFGILPDVATLYILDWSHYPGFCSARFMAHGSFVSTSTYLVCALNVCKLLSLLYPLRSRMWSRKFATTLAITIWIFSLSCSGLILAVALTFDEMYFDFRTYMCMYKVTTPPMKLVGILQTTLQWTIPDILVLSSSVWIIVVARKKARTQKKWRWQNVVTVLMVVAAFCVSYLPLTGMFTVINFVLVQSKATVEAVNEAGRTIFVYVEYDRTGQPMSGFVYIQLYALLCMLTYLNSVANIFIYYASMVSFKNGLRKFLFEKILGRNAVAEEMASLRSMSMTDGSLVRANTINVPVGTID